MAASTDVTILGALKELINSENRKGPITHDFDLSFSLSSGTGSGQADLVASDRRTLNSTSEVLDLTGTSATFKDADSNDIDFAKMKMIVIRWRGTSGVLQWGPDATNGWGAATGGPVADASDRREIGAGDFDFWYSSTGIAVTDSSADEIQVTTTANGEYDIWLLGTSA